MRPGQQWLLPYAWVQDTEPAVEAEGQRFQGHPGTVTTGPAPVACPVCPAAALQKPSQPELGRPGTHWSWGVVATGTGCQWWPKAFTRLS